MPATATRRERLRAELTEQIIEIGRRQLAEGGVANVSWRGIATEVGMNPASLYTYVDGIVDLYTRILGHSFRSLADAVEQAARSAADLSPRERLLSCVDAYRDWAVEKPNQFNLIFTNQIPGYAAPTEGAAFDAAQDVNTPFVEALGETLAIEAGSGQALQEFSDEVRTVAYGLRSLMHGFTILEINNHAPYEDGAGTLLRTALERMLDDAVANSRRQ